MSLLFHLLCILLLSFSQKLLDVNNAGDIRRGVSSLSFDLNGRVVIGDPFDRQRIGKGA